ncbi:unnamed protein product [Pleuronectes platessa]|uniref:Uncharacterized protein n=1 Tax=Pleuronectes platessa TaxID=8262 RepID=A0A9N7UV40_PLEPL|nr:unnamed protein product [Pleuronectes platessa]
MLGQSPETDHQTQGRVSRNPSRFQGPRRNTGALLGLRSPKGGHQTLEPRDFDQAPSGPPRRSSSKGLIIPAEETMFRPVEEQDESVPIRPSRRRCNRGTSATELEQPRSFTGLPENPRATRKQHREGHSKRLYCLGRD